MSKASNPLPAGAIIRTSITAVSRDSVSETQDLVAVEEPLEIRIVAEFEGRRRSQSLSVTMRSPGHDFELAAGFLLAEGIIAGVGDIWRLAYCDDAAQEDTNNIVDVHLQPSVTVDPDRFRRHVYTSSSCGVCGKESIAALRRLGGKAPAGDLVVERGVLRSLGEKLLAEQQLFSRTGGLHACGVFTRHGALELVREDVGRHNAVDKAVGRMLLDGALPASSAVLLVSGRASFELVHKAMAAGISVLLAVGAPSSLAVETARAFEMTLVGFLRDDRFNVYCGRGRIGGI